MTNDITTAVTFSSIPQTYTDLVLKVSAALVGGFDGHITFNAAYTSSITTYSFTQMGSFGTFPSGTPAVASANTYNNYYDFYLNSPFYRGTSSEFGVVESYISNYTSSENKTVFNESFSGNSYAACYIIAQAGLLRNTAPVTSIYIWGSDYPFATGSRFDLYGIKKA